MIRYLREYQALGTAGGIYHFRDEIIRGNPQQFFVMHVDVACTFPLNEMVAAHMRHRGLCTMLSTKVPCLRVILLFLTLNASSMSLGSPRSSQQVWLSGPKS